ncbi:hypothetical protein AB0K89_31190 [Streptomyces cinnamoneus]|uniref:hypothetical protein n=1 Tax=Streptomyces cinnamoneus TaxID=53446 RepID=UPI00343EF04B
MCLWRLPFAFGYTMGWAGHEVKHSVWVMFPYVVGLSVLSEALALLSFGLVRWWGEVVPDWVPVLRGKRIPPFVVIVPAALGGLVITGLLVGWVLATFHIAGFSTVEHTSVWWAALATTVSGLMNLWGPLLLILTYAYYRRRCRPDD